MSHGRPRMRNQRQKSRSPGQDMGSKISSLVWGSPEERAANERFEYFWQAEDVYSQWYNSPFFIDDRQFSCMEQYMMYKKAVLFGDEETGAAILQSRSPRQMKKLGRQVKHLDYRVWKEECIDIVRNGNIAKFSQNKYLKEKLFGTYPKVLVEASPHDDIWGIGLRRSDPEAFQVDSWRGLNLLGYIITSVRDELMIDQHIIHRAHKTVELEVHRERLRHHTPAKHGNSASSPRDNDMADSMEEWMDIGTDVDEKFNSTRSTRGDNVDDYTQSKDHDGEVDERFDSARSGHDEELDDDDRGYGDVDGDTSSSNAEHGAAHSERDRACNKTVLCDSTKTQHDDTSGNDGDTKLHAHGAGNDNVDAPKPKPGKLMVIEIP